MAKVDRYVCDKCGHTSNGEGTGGWLALDKPMGIPALVVYPLRAAGPRLERDGEQAHYCGMVCTLSVVQDVLRDLLGRETAS